MATQVIPLFPLGTVLLPGAPLSLNVFEARYRTLVADLLERPEDERRFGVVAIRSGHEVGVDAVHSLHDVGCIAAITGLRAGPDGSYALEAVGSTRFRVGALFRDRPYLCAEAEMLPEPMGEVGSLAGTVGARYQDYRVAIGGLRGVEPEATPLPTDPRMLSYLVAATVVADISDRQRFLAEPDAAARLAVEADWLVRETALVRQLSALPAGRSLDVPASIN
jgi:Lon protease-like protein